MTFLSFRCWKWRNFTNFMVGTYSLIFIRWRRTFSFWFLNFFSFHKASKMTTKSSFFAWRKKIIEKARACACNQIFTKSILGSPREQREKFLTPHSHTVRICYSVGLWFSKIYHYNRCIITSDVHSLRSDRKHLFTRCSMGLPMSDWQNT